MAKIKSKQVERVLSGSIKVSGAAVLANSSSLNVTTSLTSALTIAGDGGTAVALVVSGSNTAGGVIVNSPYNRCEVFNSTSKKKIATTVGDEVYGRLSQSSGVYTLSFYSLPNSGTETPYVFPANSTIDFDFNYRYSLDQLPADVIIGQISRNVYQDAKANGGGILQIEQLTVFSLNNLSPLSNVPNDPTKVELVINGQVIDSLGGSSAAFSISGGVNISWSATNGGYSLETTDRVVARYFI